MKTDEELTLFAQLEHVTNSVTRVHLLVCLVYQVSSPIGKYLHYTSFYTE